MTNIPLLALLSFVIAYVTIPVIIHIADEKKLFDLPDNRKKHTKLVSPLGGVGIFAGFFLSFLYFLGYSPTSEFGHFLAAGLILFFLGVKDDLMVMSASRKFAGQLIVALVVVFKGGLNLTTLYGLFGINEISYLGGALLSCLVVLLVINAVNLIDGVDGLAGSLGLAAMCLFGTYFCLTGQTPYAAFAFCMAGSLLAFLRFNFAPAKIFMGDTGSMMIGLVASILLLKFLVTIHPGSPFYSAAPALGLSVLMVPILDTLRVFNLRIWQGRSPFSPDRSHIHHLLLDKGLNHKGVTLTLSAWNAAGVALVILFSGMGPWLLLLMALVYIIITSILSGGVRFKTRSSALLKGLQPSSLEIPGIKLELDQQAVTND